MKHIPQRTCIVCRQTFDKSALNRIVKSDEGIFLDRSGKANGRGAYVCSSGECADNLYKRRALDKTFKTKIDAQVYESIVKDLKDDGAKR